MSGFNTAKSRVKTCKNRLQMRLSLMLLLFFPLWAHAMNSETAVAAGGARATLPNVLSATERRKRKQSEGTQGTSSMRNRQPRSTKKAKKRENGQSSSPSGSSDMDTDNAEEIVKRDMEKETAEKKEKTLALWRRFEIHCNAFFQGICDSRGDDWPFPGDTRPWIPGEAIDLLRRGATLYDTCDHEDLQRELGILGTDEDGQSMDAAGCHAEYEKIARRELPRGYGVDALVVLRDDKGKITEVLLLQHKYHKKCPKDLDTFRRAQWKVKEKCGLDRKPLALLVCPQHTIVPKEKMAMYTGRQAEADRLYMVKVDGFKEEEETEETKLSRMSVTATPRRAAAHTHTTQTRKKKRRRRIQRI